MVEQIPLRTQEKISTGFEHKTLRVVLENWLYHNDISVIMDAATELRRRFGRTFPRPKWAGGGDNGG